VKYESNRQSFFS